MKVKAIYTSISGEVGAVPAGTPIIILRLAGCNLACPYCDAPETQDADTPDVLELTVDQVLSRIQSLGLSALLITGGEPLLQLEEVTQLIAGLEPMRQNGAISSEFSIQIETNGSVARSELHRLSADWYGHFALIMDIKTIYYAATCKQIEAAVRLDLLPYLPTARNEVQPCSIIYKVPVRSLLQIETVCRLVNETCDKMQMRNARRGPCVFVSPITTELSYYDACQCVIRHSHGQVGLNAQLHKLIKQGDTFIP